MAAKPIHSSSMKTDKSDLLQAATAKALAADKKASAAKKRARLAKANLKAAKLPVRVSKTGCLGPCAQGPNVMCYGAQGRPGVWLQGVEEGDVAEIEAKVKGMLAEP